MQYNFIPYYNNNGKLLGAERANLRGGFALLRAPLRILFLWKILSAAVGVSPKK